MRALDLKYEKVTAGKLLFSNSQLNRKQVQAASHISDAVITLALTHSLIQLSKVSGCRSPAAA
jgi:hypothetical protein